MTRAGLKVPVDSRCYSCHHGRGRWDGHEFGRNDCDECPCTVYVSPAFVASLEPAGQSK